MDAHHSASPGGRDANRYAARVATDLSHAASAFGLGMALGVSPGPVQMVLLTESARGGAGRGFRAMAGANATFGVLLVALAAGVSLLSPSGTGLRALRIVGGVFLLFVAADAVLSARSSPSGPPPSSGRLHPLTRGVLAVLVNPGAWLFLATTASAVMADASRDGGRAIAMATAAAMLAGVAVADGSVVLVASAGRRRLGERSLRVAGYLLAAGLAALGAFLVFEGLTQ